MQAGFSLYFLTVCFSIYSAVESLDEQLLEAARSGSLEVIKEILNNNASSNTLNKNQALHEAAEAGQVEIVKLLLIKGADLHSTGKNQASVLGRAAIAGQTAVVKVLIEAAADVNSKNEFGITPLHHACVKNHVEIVTLLLQAKASVFTKTKKNKTALDLAREYSSHEATWLLEKHIQTIQLKKAQARKALYCLITRARENHREQNYISNLPMELLELILDLCFEPQV